jgi:hypothetical protein
MATLPGMAPRSRFGSEAAGRLVIRRRPNSAAALYWAGLIQPAGREDLGDGG